MKIKYENKDFKTILNKYKFIDNWFWCRYSINTYNGCEHACTYCDSRSHKYHLHPEFDQIIYIKNNAGEMLDKRISRARTLLPDTVALSGTCDPYQPAEEEFENTKACLEVLAKHKYPVLIGTKSKLVIRDIDLLDEIGERSWCSVGITVTTTDNELTEFLEPHTPTPKERFDTIKKLKKLKNIQVGVNLMPIVPYLGDSDDALDDLTKKAKQAGVDYILFSAGMTMRDRQAVWYLKRLKEEYPDLVEKYLELFDARIDGGEYKGKYGPKGSYAKRINKRMFELCDKYDINYRIKRYIPDDFRRENYLIAEEFLNEAYDQQSTGKPWSNLFWAGQNINNLKEPIRSIAARGELKKIRNVDEALEKRITDKLIIMK